ncbi:ORF6N domain-containing protein [Niabella sp. CC-SYL272]|uniref:ORF6N domain-containing protein n=1 Tax=Niabella agricola TaxID=2891571 RepID=UPI001F15B14F|nr:ORF6N domain-containing protein [Niabella agricola]MCF3110420.1 ORF6N domain-containing protein [Niabella agricola]
MQIIRNIQNRIYEIRGERIILDFDLAILYEVETRILNQTVKRNSKRFPKDFMFQLTRQEFAALKPEINKLYSDEYQSVTDMSSQFVMTYPGKRPKTALPYAFTEQGVAMLSGLLNSDTAIQMNIAIMRAFVEIRRIVLEQGDIRDQLKQIQQRITEHDVQLSSIYDAIENLLDEKAAQKK